MFEFRRGVNLDLVIRLFQCTRCLSGGIVVVLPKHLVPVVDHIRALPAAALPEPWKRSGVFSVGGLTDVGFAPSSDMLLVISSQGRGLFDCLSGEKMDRDYDDGFYFDTMALEAEGIGAIAGRSVRTAGLHGGGLARQTNDGWAAEELHIDWPESTLLLVEPGSWIYGKAFDKPTKYTKVHVDSEVRTWGFSPTGRSLVLATSTDLTLFYR
jgi:hypothetical protein